MQDKKPLPDMDDENRDDEKPDDGHAGKPTTPRVGTIS
jgi:hypothetical protein